MSELKCTCHGKLNEPSIKGEIESDPSALDNAVVTFQTTLSEQPSCDSPCTNPPNTRFDWTISIDSKDPSEAPNPSADIVRTLAGPPDFKVIFARDATYKFTVSIKMTVECQKLLSEKQIGSHGVKIFQRNGPALEDVQSLQLTTTPF